MNFCTLFDSNYLDKGLVLCDSLNKTDAEFTLYIFAFDKKAYDILCDLKIPNVVVIQEQDILDAQIQKIKEERSRAEYCWTCTPIIIQYVLEHFEVKECTYIDADMYFYSSPQVLMDEIEASGCSVSIIRHRFPNNIAKKTNEKFHGRYCVEFNTFFSDLSGKKVLQWWREKCIESCSMKLYDKSFGDQKYLDEWPKKFECIHEIEHLGAGVAPWNIADYRFVSEQDGRIVLRYKRRKEVPLIFYHFQNLNFLNNGDININVYNEMGKFDGRLLNRLYDDYIERLKQKRNFLKNRYALIFKMQPKRKEVTHWKYTGMRDLITYIFSFINGLLRGKQNIKH